MGVTRSRSRSRGVLLSGLEVSASAPLVAGGAIAEPNAEGTTPGPGLGTTVLLRMSTGISKIAISLLRRHFGQRTAMSNRFSPSTILDIALAPRAVATTLLTSAI